MNMAQDLKFNNALSPQSLNSAAGTTTTTDTTGFKYATVVAKFGAVGGAATVLKLTECDTSGGSYSDITGAVSSGSTGDGRLPQTGDANKYFIWYVRLGGTRKPFLKPEVTTGATTLVSIDVILSDAFIGPDTIAERGVTSQVFVNS